VDNERRALDDQVRALQAELMRASGALHAAEHEDAKLSRQQVRLFLTHC
jgi:hypothetical protein